MIPLTTKRIVLRQEDDITFSHFFASHCLVSTISDSNIITFAIGVICALLAVVELGVGGSVSIFVSGFHFFDGSVYVFGSWWSVLLVLVCKRYLQHPKCPYLCVFFLVRKL